MIQADCDRLPNYQGWIKPPAIYDRCQPNYEDSQAFDQAEIDEWLDQAEDTWAASDHRSAALEIAHTSALQVIDIKQLFEDQAERWSSETAHLSSPVQIMMHPSYLAILGMANENQDEIVRLMIRDLRTNRRLWFWARSDLTKENPIKSSDAGRLDAMIKAWSDWGKSRGIV
jgi:hypothetical protein